MNNIVVFNCFITIDSISQKLFCASSNREKLVFPNYQITSPKFLYHEIRVNIKNLFANNAIQFLEEINLSFIDIQNYLLMSLLEEDNKKIYTDIKDDDIILLSGCILNNKLMSDQLTWLPIDNILFPKSLGISNTENRIVKHVFDKMLV